MMRTGLLRACTSTRNILTPSAAIRAISFPVPLKDYVTGKLRHSLILLWTAVGMILLIACVNLSNLLLSRAVARGKEFAVRGALGASRGRIIRQLLIESLVLSGAGAGLGLGLALLVISWLAHQGSLALPLLSTLRIDAEAASLERAGRGRRRRSLRPRSRDSAWRWSIFRKRSKTPARARDSGARANASVPCSSSQRSRSPACCWSAPGFCYGAS